MNAAMVLPAAHPACGRADLARVPPMAPAEWRLKLRKRIPHVLVLGFAVFAMDELRVLPMVLETASLVNLLLSGVLVFFDSMAIALILVTLITVAEQTRFARKQRVLTLAATVIAASLLAAWLSVQNTVLLETWVPDTMSEFGVDLRGVFFHILWVALSIGFLAAMYFTVWERAQQAATQLRAAELERQGIERRVVESRLNVMKARVEPEFLFRSIGEIQRLYRQDVPAAERHLEDLIAYLRAALPQMRGGASTLGDELQLASTYLRLHDEAFRGRLDWSFEVDEALYGVHFPPMALLPLIDDALRRAIDLVEPRLTLSVRASVAAGQLAVAVVDDSPIARTQMNGEIALVAQQQAFTEFFGGDAMVRRLPGPDGGTTVILEASFDDGARGNR